MEPMILREFQVKKACSNIVVYADYKKQISSRKIGHAKGPY
jgi:hypothetical protein